MSRTDAAVQSCRVQLRNPVRQLKQSAGSLPGSAVAVFIYGKFRHAEYSRILALCIDCRLRDPVNFRKGFEQNSIHTFGKENINQSLVLLLCVFLPARLRKTAERPDIPGQKTFPPHPGSKCGNLLLCNAAGCPHQLLLLLPGYA